MPDTPIPTVG